MIEFVRLDDVKRMLENNGNILDLKIYEAGYEHYFPIQIRDYSSGNPIIRSAGADSKDLLKIDSYGHLVFMNEERYIASYNEQVAKTWGECCVVPTLEKGGAKYITPIVNLVIKGE